MTAGFLTGLGYHFRSEQRMAMPAEMSLVLVRYNFASVQRISKYHAGNKPLILCLGDTNE